MSTPRSPRRVATLLATVVATALAVVATGLVVVAGPVYAAVSYPVPADGVFHLAGHGWGHGRGMSQQGAQGAATQGVSAEDILSAYYPGTTAGTIAAAPIRVLLQGDDEADLQVGPATGLAVRDLASGTSFALPVGPKRWRAYADAAGLHLQSYDGTHWFPYDPPDPADASGATLVHSFVGPLQFESASPERLYYPDGSSRDYRGTLRAVRTGPITIDTVDVLSLEDYLLGVVPRESPSSYRPAALQAQAIAARSYSAYERANASASAPYDICDSTSCQVFGGSASYPAGSNTATALEPDSTTAAVTATSGQVRLYDGAPIFAEYSASNGGFSVDGGEPYLVAHADPWDGVLPSAQHSWTATLAAADLERRFPSVGHLRTLTVLERDGNGDWGGRVLRVELDGVDDAGRPTSATTTGSGIYQAKSWPAAKDGLKSSWWTIVDAPSGTPTGGIPVVGAAFHPLPPARILDTRHDGGPIGSGQTRTLTVAGAGGVPTAGVTGAVLNVTATNPTATAYLTAWPHGSLRPTTSSLNWTPGASVANLVTSALGAGGTLDLYNSGGRTDVVVDVAGYFTAASAGGSLLNPLPPSRVLDTRKAVGVAARAPLAAGTTLHLTVAGHGGVPPSGATAVALNLTATGTTAATDLRVWPGGLAKPHVSNLNLGAGATRANSVVVPLGHGGDVAIATSAGSTHVVADVLGWYGASGGGFVGMVPTRLMDTRTGFGGTAHPVAAGSDVALAVAGHGGVPSSGAAAVVLNVTATRTAGPGFLTVWPSGLDQPLASNLNYVAAQSVPGQVVVPLGTDGRVAIYAGGAAADVVVDVVGWVTAG